MSSPRPLLPDPPVLSLGDLAGRSPAGLAAIGQFLAEAEEDALSRYWMPVTRALAAHGLPPAAGAPELWQRVLATVSMTADSSRPVVHEAWQVLLAAGGPPATLRTNLADVGVLPKFLDPALALEQLLLIVQAPWWTARDRTYLLNRLLHHHSKLPLALSVPFLRRLDPWLPGVFPGVLLAGSFTPEYATVWLDGLGFRETPDALLALIDTLPDDPRTPVADALWHLFGDGLSAVPGGTSTALRWASARVRLSILRSLPSASSVGSPSR